jgi:hypothetical protein
MILRLEMTLLHLPVKNKNKKKKNHLDKWHTFCAWSVSFPRENSGWAKRK